MFYCSNAKVLNGQTHSMERHSIVRILLRASEWTYSTEPIRTHPTKHIRNDHWSCIFAKVTYIKTSVSWGSSISVQWEMALMKIGEVHRSGAIFFLVLRIHRVSSWQWVWWEGRDWEEGEKGISEKKVRIREDESWRKLDVKMNLKWTGNELELEMNWKWVIRWKFSFN